MVPTEASVKTPADLLADLPIALYKLFVPCFVAVLPQCQGLLFEVSFSVTFKQLVYAGLWAKDG